MTSTNVCFCIPARIKSSRLNSKLLLKLGNEYCIEKTVKQVLKSTFFSNNVFVLTDSEDVKNILSYLPITIIMTPGEYQNGTDRICRNLDKIPVQFEYIVNIQADEPFISVKNIDHAINKHLENNSEHVFYTTLHEENNSHEYLKSTASLKLVTDHNNNVMLYSRNIIPWNKDGNIKTNYVYKTFTGIYVFNRQYLATYGDLAESDLQIMEDCEQLKILEAGFKIKSFQTEEYNEISLNTKEDYEYLLKKYHY